MRRLSRDGIPSGSEMSSKLGGVGAVLQFQPVYGEGGWIPMPPLDHAEAEDEQEAASEAELFSYEVDIDSWSPIAASGEASNPPVRFVDGTISSTTAGLCTVQGVRRPLLVASLGAAELFLDGSRLYRPDDGYRVIVALAIVSNGIPSRLLETLREELFDLGIHLIALETAELTMNFELLRRRSWDFLKQEMEGLEKEIILRRPEISTVADGLLERRLTTQESHTQPVIGMVKRNLRQYLPNKLAPMLYDLSVGERSPTFVIRTPHAELVSWYLKLAGGPISPGNGLVRLAVAREYLETFQGAERFDEVSGISSRLCALRCREESYERNLVSLEPIVRLEDQLRALLPSVDPFAARVRKHLLQT